MILDENELIDSLETSMSELVIQIAADILLSVPVMCQNPL